jgi:predicted membrane protein
MSIYYTLLLLLHTLLLVYWLGLDLAIFYCGSHALRLDLPPLTRALLARIMFTLDLVPRFCLLLMFPVGATLALSGGYATLTESEIVTALIVVWSAAFAWIAGVSLLARHPAWKEVRVAEAGIRVAFIVMLLGLALTSWLGHGPIDQKTGWLQTKLALFALIVAGRLAIRIKLNRFRLAQARLNAGETTPELEKLIAGSIIGARPIIIAVWVGIILEAYLGLSKLY